MQERSKPYRFKAIIHRLSIQKNIQFDCKIIWKRHNNKTETQTVKHAHGFSTYEQQIHLDINMVQMTQNGAIKFKQKNTEFVVLITMNGKIKSGGFAKYDVSKLIGKDHAQQTIYLSECPDSKAYIEMTLKAQDLGQTSSVNQSILNASSRDLNYSRLVLNEKNKSALEIQKINIILETFQQLNSQIKDRVAQKGSKVPQLIRKIQILQGQKNAIEKQLKNTQEKILNQQESFKAERKQLKKQINDLEKQLHKRQSKTSVEQVAVLTADQLVNRKEYKILYQRAMQQIEQLKQIALKDSIGKLEGSFQDFVSKKNEQLTRNEETQQKPEQVSLVKNVKRSANDEQMHRLAKQNNELQNSLATMSHKLATLFNASLNYGGQQLVDYLQTSIGITE